MGRRGIRRLKMRMEREYSISRRRARWYSGDIHVGGDRGESQCYEWEHNRGRSSKSDSCQEL